MSFKIQKNGFEIHRSVLSSEKISELRTEADAIAKAAGTACVRHLRGLSHLVDDLSQSKTLLSLLPTGFQPVRSILFDKTKSENWPVAWHQDLTIAVAEKKAVNGYGSWSFKDGSPHVQAPVSLLENMVTIRLHLDDTPAANGALRVVPGSHKNGKINADDLVNFSKTSCVTCECAAGDALLMVPLILHASQRAEVATRRRVIHIEYARKDQLDPHLKWFER